MIPTMILFGLILGRWWKSCLTAGTVGWPMLLWVDGIIRSPSELFGAAGLAAVNTLVGVVVHQLLLCVVRSIRRSRRAPDRTHA